MSINTCKMWMRRVVNGWVRETLNSLCRKLDGIARLQHYGHQISYDLSTDIGRMLSSSGEFEKTEMELCEKYISKSSIVLDIGANIGLHSIYFSGLSKEGYVLAFEPSLETFRLLANNVGDIPNIVPIRLALSDGGGVVDFFHASDNAYSSLLNTHRKEIVSVIKVPCMKVDDVVFGLCLSRVDFVKIDVEGLEFNVLKGMVDVVSKYKPVIFCEIYKGSHSNQQPGETVEFLLQMGYRAFVMRGGKMIDYEKHNDDYYNYLFLPI